MFKKIALVVTIALFVGLSTHLFAEGVRPLSMGGAFVAVADDVHSIYWNPAGLPRVHEPELTLAHWINLRDKFNPADLVALVFPAEYGALGIGYTLNEAPETSHHINVAYGIPIPGTPDNTKFSAGINATAISDPDNNYVTLDLGILWEIWPQFTFGLVGQNSFISKGGTDKVFYNLQPGIAFKPIEGTTLALDVNDATDQSPDGANLRFGIETHVWKIAFRAGGYNIYNENGAATAGIGYETRNFKIDYGLIYWVNSEEIQHMAAVRFKFPF